MSDNDPKELALRHDAEYEQAYKEAYERYAEQFSALDREGLWTLHELASGQQSPYVPSEAMRLPMDAINDPVVVELFESFRREIAALEVQLSARREQK